MPTADSPPQSLPSSAFFFLTMFGCLASLAMYWITNQGPGVTADSTIYLETAQNLIAGKGLTYRNTPLTHYPPVYPMLLGLVGLLTQGNLVQGARLLAALLFGINATLFAFAVHYCTRQSWLETGAGILFFACSAPALYVQNMAWSEGPYITFSMTAFLVLAHYLSRPSLRLLVLAALLAGVAVATRYIGVIVIPTMALALLILGGRSSKTRMKDAVLFAGIAALPLACWLLRNKLVSRNVTNREFTSHPATLEHVNGLVNKIFELTLSGLTVSGRVFIVTVAATVFLLGCLLLFQRVRALASPSIADALWFLCTVYFFAYVAFLFFSISFLDANTPVDTRLLLPPYLALTIAAFALACSLSDVPQQRRIRYYFLIGVLFCASTNASSAASMALYLHNNGSGYTDVRWSQSETVQFVGQTAQGKKVYANESGLLTFLSGKVVRAIPQSSSLTSLKSNEKFQQQVADIRKEVREGKALIVSLNAFRVPEEVPLLKDLPILQRMHDSTIYGGAETLQQVGRRQR